MLDVHAPEHPISGKRDFFIHLFTITVGLLIALGLENTAESIHHRHLRNEAIGNIRQELQQNRDTLTRAAPVVLREQQSLTHLLDTFQTVVAANTSTTLSPDQLAFQEAPIPDAAWQTAASTGAVSYMEYDQVQRFSAAYKEQTLLQTAEEKALDDYLELMPILRLHGGNVTPAQAAAALPVIQKALAHVSGMLAIGQGTLGTYDEALK